MSLWLGGKEINFCFHIKYDSLLLYQRLSFQVEYEEIFLFENC